MKLQNFGLVYILTLLTGLNLNCTPLISTQQKSLEIERKGELAERRQSSNFEIFLKQGIKQLEGGDIQSKIESLQQELTRLRKQGDVKGEQKVLNLLGDLYQQQEKYPQAIKYYQQSLEITRQLKDRNQELLVLNNLGEAYKNSRDYDHAIATYQERLSLSREIPKSTNQESSRLHTAFSLMNESISLLGLGSVYSAQGDQQKALEYTQLALEAAQKLKNNPSESQIQDSQLRSKVLELMQQLKQIGVELEFLSIQQLSLIYGLNGDFIKETETLQRQLSLARSLGDKQVEIDALTGLSYVYKEANNYLQAIDYAKQSLALAKQINDFRRAAKILRNLATIYGEFGDFEQEKEYAQQGLNAAQKLSHRQQTQTRELSEHKQIEMDAVIEIQLLETVGICYLFQKQDINKSRQYFEESLALAKRYRQGLPDVANALFYLAIVDAVSGNFQQAVNNGEQALSLYRSAKRPQFQIFERMSEAAMLVILAENYASLGNTEKAMKYLQQAIDLVQGSGNTSDQISILDTKGRILLLSGNFLEAEKTLREAIDNVNRIWKDLPDKDREKVSYLDMYSNLYELLQQVFVAEKQPNNALEIAEEGRSKRLVELLSAKLNPTQIIQSPKIEQIKNIAKTENATLVEYSIIYEKTAHLLPGRIQGLQSNLESELLIWVVKPNGDVILRRSNLKTWKQQYKTTLAQLIINSRESIGVRSRSPNIVPELVNPINQTERLTQLHKLLIEPIADVLPTDPNAHVIFMPQGELFLVPFPALQDENGKYLIEKHTIVTAPAIQVLDLTQKQRVKVQQANPKGLVVVGNPTMPKVTVKIGEPPEQLNPLPAAENEAITIAKLLNTKALTGNEATKTAILSQLPQARIIHLATHGLLDDFKGLGVPGAIALAPSGNDNGLLTADEILNLKLNAELVVLSACDTGRGRITGDGVIGLSRSLITAGVPSIIVSLWSVPDAPTASLMTEFYRNWQEKKLDKAQALRQAMLTTMKNHPNPKDWAAFTLIGEAE